MYPEKQQPACFQPTHMPLGVSSAAPGELVYLGGGRGGLVSGLNYIIITGLDPLGTPSVRRVELWKTTTGRLLQYNNAVFNNKTI